MNFLDLIFFPERCVVVFTVYRISILRFEHFPFIGTKTPKTVFWIFSWHPYSWFELEWAEAQIRAGKLGFAMKKALAVHTHFEDFVEDQFDFHTYCMRKVKGLSPRSLGVIGWCEA